MAVDMPSFCYSQEAYFVNSTNFGTSLLKFTDVGAQMYNISTAHFRRKHIPTGCAVCTQGLGQKHYKGFGVYSNYSCYIIST